MQKSYKHIFFDLDRTLWDFEKSSVEAFHHIYRKYDLHLKGVDSVDLFIKHYTHHNNILWNEYREGKLAKSVLRGLRFERTLEEFGVNDKDMAQKIGSYYVEISPLLVHLFPHAHEILDYLRPRYSLHIITNGFSEVQYTKLQASGLDKYFEHVITSEEAGVKKPNPQIFTFAFDRTQADPKASLMIGDDVDVDILGARQVGMDQVLFDPEKNYSRNGSTHYINNLIELKTFL